VIPTEILDICVQCIDDLVISGTLLASAYWDLRLAKIAQMPLVWNAVREAIAKSIPSL
jgi:hypothetical protein